MRLAVFVSGNGSNLQCIIDAVQQKMLNEITIDVVIADRDCFAIQRAEQAGIEVMVVTRKSNWDDEIYVTLKSKQISHIVLAGFLSILNNTICEEWKNKIINLHPSLLPKFGGKGMYGLKVHQEVIENKETQSGATVHYVTEGVDEGNILMQKTCSVDLNETPDSLQKKVHLLEKEILIESIKVLYAKAQGTD
jgi:phosphoribosylglycinamide formyltransferase-1